MKALVVGGNRYFGKRLVQKLISEGHEITLLNRGSVPSPKLSKHLICDRNDYSSLKEKISGQTWDVIYDQVCLSAKSAKLAIELLAPKAQKYILSSSMSVYDEGPNLSELDFDASNYSFSQEADPEVDYAVAKRQVEAIFAHAKIPYTAVRFPIVLGLDDFRRRLLFHIERIKEGNGISFPNLMAKITFISSLDAAESLYKLGGELPLGPLNVGSSEAVVLNDLMSLIEIAVREKMKSSHALEDASPFGIGKDWFLNVEKAEKRGVVCKPTKEWLGPLILEMAK